MIASYRDKRTERFANGAHVKEFSGFSRQAEVRLDRLEAANSLRDLAALLSKGRGKGSTASVSTTNGGFASSGQKVRPARSMWRSSIITEEGAMARTPIHPGEHLAEELKELGVSAAELARQIDVPVNRVTAILNGQRGVTADTALRLGHWFGTSPEFWLNLQTLYELRRARKLSGARVNKLPTLAAQKTKVSRARKAS
jgi:addiction module HigA family antidote